ARSVGALAAGSAAGAPVSCAGAATVTAARTAANRRRYDMVAAAAGVYRPQQLSALPLPVIPFTPVFVSVRLPQSSSWNVCGTAVSVKLWLLPPSAMEIW